MMLDNATAMRVENSGDDDDDGGDDEGDGGGEDDGGCAHMGQPQRAVSMHISPPTHHHIQPTHNVRSTIK